MHETIVLSCFHTQPLLRARHEGHGAARASLDLGLTQDEVLLEPDRVILPDGQWLSWDGIQQISQNESACFLIEGNNAEKIQRFSKPFNRFYSLMPTKLAPTLLISGIAMHRIKGIDPHRDTLKKIRTITPITGRVLDICTGLGYTAIEAAKTAEQVLTIELDPTVLEVARLNPWSHPLFIHPHIHQVIGDAYEEIASFEAESFSRIIHDPPMFSLAGDLYSGEFYGHLFRVMSRKGRLFHYVGDLDSRSGRNVARGVARRLQDAGFSRVVRRPGAFGLVAYKG